MTRSRSSLARLFCSLVAAALLASACAGSNDDITETDATETNFIGLACNSDEECIGGYCKLHDEQPPPGSSSPRGTCKPLPEAP
jgi:hypothetical protein